MSRSAGAWAPLPWMKTPQTRTSGQQEVRSRRIVLVLARLPVECLPGSVESPRGSVFSTQRAGATP